HTILMIPRHLLCVLAATLATASAAPRAVSCRVISFGKNPEIPAELFCPAKVAGEFNKAVPSLSVESFPVEIFVPENGEIRFTAAANAASPVIATAIIPPGAEKAYLFLLADPTPGDAKLFQIVAIEDSPQATPPGGAMIHNATLQEARVTLAKDIHPLSPGKSVSLTNPTGKDEYNMAPLKIEIQANGRWTSVKDGLTRFSPRDLYLIFTYPGPQPDKALVKIYQKSVTISTAGKKKP
ncbi:MAG: hypothetical protein ABI600_12610, partial [Luteolibacter sp.]